MNWLDGLGPAGRRKALTGALVVLALLVAYAVIATVLKGDDGHDSPPAALATKLVPADALIYVHLSTDRGRKGTADAEKLATGFPGYQDLLKTVVKRLSAPGCKVASSALARAKEAAIALVDTGSGNAGSLVYVDTGDTTKEPEKTCGTIQTGKFGRFLVIGQAQSIVIARQLAAGKGKTLAADPAYLKALAKLPKDRVADAWVSQSGVKRLLEPQGGLIGAAGTLLDQPGTTATAAAVVAAKGGAKVILRSQRAAGTAAGDGGTFTPSLPKDVPGDVLGYLGLKGLTGSAGRLLGLVGGQTSGLAPLLARAAKDLAPLISLFSGEVAVTITPDTPAPVLSIVTQAKDPAAASATLAAARPKIARLLASSGQAVPEWKIIGRGYRLRPAPGVEIDYAVIGKLIVVSTRQAGLSAIRNRKGAITDTKTWKASVGNAEKPITSLVFLDFNQLLRLGEQTGLNDSRAYLAAKDDLQKLKAVGARSSSEGDESTVELFLSFP